jgi:hypothetical protein
MVHYFDSRSQITDHTSIGISSEGKWTLIADTVKVKFTLEQAMKVQRGSRGMSLFIP